MRGMQVYLNGEYVAAAQACVSVQDRSFRYGDGVFETVRVEAGVPYQWPLHMARLNAGLAALGMVHDTRALAGIAATLLAENAVQRGLLRIHLSRGVGGRGYQPSAAATPSVVMECMPLPEPPGEITLWQSAYEKISPRALPVQHKLAQGLQSTLVMQEAAAHACDDGLLLNTAGHITETARANVFWLHGGTLHTPALSCGVLAGTMRAALLRLSPWPVREGEFAAHTLQAAEEVWVCNAALGVVPVAALLPKAWRWPARAGHARMHALLQHDMDDRTWRAQFA